MLAKVVADYEGIYSIDIEERLDSANIKARVNSKDSSFFLALNDALNTISSRDRFELLLDFDGLELTISESSQENVEGIRQFISKNDCADDDLIDLNLTIYKETRAGVHSIYLINKFDEYVLKADLLNLVGSINSRFSDSLKFEVFSEIKRFGSKSIAFVSSSDTINLIDPDVYGRRDRHSIFFDNATSINFKSNAGNFLPGDFKLNEKSPFPGVNRLFEAAVAALSLVFISNSSELKPELRLAFKIIGYKAIICDDIEPVKLVGSADILHRIYEWAYEGGTGSDKLGLIRNLMSIHLEGNGDLKLDAELWDAIKSNYQIYLRGNIQSYLEVKNRIGEILISSIEKTSSLVDELSSSLKNNAAIIFTFLVTVVLVNGLKDSGENIIFSTAYLWVVVIISSVSAAWLVVMEWDVRKRFDKSTESIGQLLRSNYSSVLMESEISACVDPVVQNNQIYLMGQVKTYRLLWGGVIALFLFLYGAGNWYFVQRASKAALPVPVAEVSKPFVPSNLQVPNVSPAAQRPASSSKIKP